MKKLNFSTEETQNGMNDGIASLQTISEGNKLLAKRDNTRFIKDTPELDSYAQADRVFSFNSVRKYFILMDVKHDISLVQIQIPKSSLVTSAKLTPATPYLLAPAS